MPEHLARRQVAVLARGYGDISATIDADTPHSLTALFDTALRRHADRPAFTAGEVCAKGPQVMRGYWNKPDANADAFTTDGYFRTGDIGMLGGRYRLPCAPFCSADKAWSMLKLPGFWLGGNALKVDRNCPTYCCAGTITNRCSTRQRS